MALGVAAGCGAAAGRGGGYLAAMAVVAALVGATVVRRRWAGILAAMVVLSAASGTLSAAREADTRAAGVPEGTHRITGRVVLDPAPVGEGVRFVIDPSHLWQEPVWTGWDGPRLAVYASVMVPVAAGERAVVTGRIVARPGSIRGDPVAGSVWADSVEPLGAAQDPLFRAGNLLRRRVDRVTSGHRGNAAGALIPGFLIGDVSDLPPAATESLRRAGLTHYVAVSGSNVALFLIAWWLVSGPLAFGPRRRAVVGLVGLAVFVVATRWEPSVVRAATMAGLMLAGGLAGVAVSAWMALGLAVAGLVVVSPELVNDVGFQLSVAATAGVLAGAGWFGRRRPRWVWSTLAATMSAQVAVAPLLLIHFGTVPAAAPLANLLAAPLVVAATAAGGLAVITGWTLLMEPAVLAARGVLTVARLTAGLPQLGVLPALVAGGAVAAGTRRRLRPAVALGLAIWLAAVVSLPGPPGEATVVFLDVGQGDAALLLGSGGEVVLIDGGPDRTILRRALTRYGVRRIDLVVASHRHADHVTGLLEAVAQVPVGRLWHPGRVEPGERLDSLVEAAAAREVPVAVPEPGWVLTIGELRVEVLGPLRRYASPNDQSIVLMVSAGGPTVLFPGDIEAIAQRELGPLPADIMKVPHQGGATSDLDWLAASAGRVAVVSVGPNDFGHPDAEVLRLLEEAGALVGRTDVAGDIPIPIGPGVDGAAGISVGGR